MNKAAYTNTKQLLNISSNAWDVVYYGLNHYQAQSVANFVKAEGVNTIKQFLKTNFDYCGELSTAKREAINQLQTKINKYMSKQTMKAVKKVKAKRVADVRKNVNAAKAAVSKVIKEQAKVRDSKKKVVAKKVTKKAVAKKVTKKQSLKDKLYTQYKIVTQYSENLMQDVFNVVYRTKTLKRFINERLATKYIDQEVLLRMNEKAVASPAKIKGIKKELEQEFA